MTDEIVRFGDAGRIRFFEEGALLFDPVTWATHVLNEDAARLARLICARLPAVGEQDVVAIARDELGWEADDPAVLQTVRILVDAELVRRDAPA